MNIEIGMDGNLQAYVLRHANLEVRVLPDLGGKISSIRWMGDELLARNPRKVLNRAHYGAPYADYDASGFDECLPTIGPCLYPDEPWQGVQLPDHGEVWSLPWICHAETRGLYLKAQGICLPYIFQKWITLSETGVIDLHYSLTNLAPFSFRYLWSSHPLLAISPGNRICLPEGVTVVVDWSKGDRLGELLCEHNWPVTLDRQGNPVDLSLVLSDQARLVDKLYTSRLGQGWCALYNPIKRRYVAFLFSPIEIPYVGLSINLGGWPVDESGEQPGYYNLGLEPCNGYPDRLDIAIQRGDCPTLAAKSTVGWRMQFRVGSTESITDLSAYLAERSLEFQTEGSRIEP